MRGGTSILIRVTPIGNLTDYDVFCVLQAALYYESPAAKVVEIVRDPRLKGSHLGAVEKVRLTADMEGVDGARRERDVVQYYQYSADMVSLFLIFSYGQLE